MAKAKARKNKKYEKRSAWLASAIIFSTLVIVGLMLVQTGVQLYYLISI